MQVRITEPNGVEERSSEFIQMVLGFGANLFKIFGALGIARKGGMVDTFDD